MLSAGEILQIQRYEQVEGKWWKKIHHTNNSNKRTGLSILISDRIDFKRKNIIGNNERYFIIIKGQSTRNTWQL